MQITLDIPDDIAAQISDGEVHLPRRSLELLAIEAYRKGLTGAGAVGQILGFDSRWDTYDFSAGENAEPPFGEADLESDRVALDAVLSRTVRKI